MDLVGCRKFCRKAAKYMICEFPSSFCVTSILKYIAAWRLVSPCVLWHLSTSPSVPLGTERVIDTTECHSRKRDGMSALQRVQTMSLRGSNGRGSNLEYHKQRYKLDPTAAEWVFDQLVILTSKQEDSQVDMIYWSFSMNAQWRPEYVSATVLF